MSFGSNRLFSAPRRIPTGEDILLTGVPRSGTTLACRLLNQVSDVVALNEPLEPAIFADRSSALDNLEGALSSIRKELGRTGEAPSRHREGRFTDNNFSSGPGPRELIVKRSMLSFGPPRPGPFTLVLKHNAEFTQLLPELSRRYSVFALIRNPLAVWISWCTVSIAASRGQLSKSDRLSPDLHSSLQKIPDLTARQQFILDWYFRQFQYLPSDHILRYEDLMETGGTCLQQVVGQVVPRDPDLAVHDQWPPGGPEEAARLRDALLRHPGAWSEHYTSGDVENHWARLPKT